MFVFSQVAVILKNIMGFVLVYYSTYWVWYAMQENLSSGLRQSEIQTSLLSYRD